MEKPDCYKCMHRAPVPGDCHSICKHPDALDPLLSLIGFLGAFKGELKLSENLIVRCSPHGVMHGWCYYPINFDPIWIEECTGYMQATEMPKSC